MLDHAESSHLAGGPSPRDHVMVHEDGQDNVKRNGSWALTTTFSDG